MQDKHLKGITQWTTNNSDDTANHDPYIDLVSKVAADINVNAISKTIMKKTKIDKLGGN